MSVCLTFKVDKNVRFDLFLSAQKFQQISHRWREDSASAYAASLLTFVTLSIVGRPSNPVRNGTANFSIFSTPRCSIQAHLLFGRFFECRTDCRGRKCQPRRSRSGVIRVIEGVSRSLSSANIVVSHRSCHSVGPKRSLRRSFRSAEGKKIVSPPVFTSQLKWAAEIPEMAGWLSVR